MPYAAKAKAQRSLVARCDGPSATVIVREQMVHVHIIDSIKLDEAILSGL